MLDLTISGKEFAVGIGVLAGVIALVIFALRLYLKKQSEDLKVKEIIHPAARNKRPEVDALRWSGTILRGGLATALAMTILAFSWTTYANEIYIPDYDVFDDEMMEVIPPTVQLPPPPPPLPPPPMVLEVTEEPDIEEPVLVDQFIDDSDVIDLKPVPEPAVQVAPVVAPPPVVVEDVKPIRFAQIMPRFLSSGCEAMTDEKEVQQCAQNEMLQFIYKNIKYPTIARENGIEGTTVIRFVVTKEGNVEQAEVLRGVAGGCAEAAMKVVQKMPKWKPGRHNGRHVDVYFNLPIKFKLD